MEHLAKSLLFSRYREDAYMVIFSAYFDASGHPDQPGVLTVAGYAAAVENWIRFDREWQEILRPEGITSFHMTDFASSEGEFKVGWKGKTERRRVFTEKLAACLQRHCAMFFRISVFIPDYNLVNLEYELSEAAGLPYAMCCMQVTYLLRKWASDLDSLDTLLYFFEDGDKDKGDFESKHKDTFGKAPIFLDKSLAIAFQAADFNAWKARAVLQKSNDPLDTPERGSQQLRSLAALDDVRNDTGVLNAWSLRAFCERTKVKKRSM